jgi:hypothetical protein
MFPKLNFIYLFFKIIHLFTHVYIVWVISTPSPDPTLSLDL